jgi:hypothetical protein
MFRHLRLANQGADFIARWGTAVGLMIGAYTWLASALPWFGELQFVEMVALAIPAALVTLLAVTASAALYRYFKAPISAAPTAHTIPYNDAELRETVDGTTEVLGAIAQDARNLSERLGALEASLAEK